MRRWLAAVIALVLGAATLVLAVAVAVSEFPRGLGVLGCVLIAGASAWYGVLRRGIARVAGLTVAGLALAGAVALHRRRAGRGSSICWCSWGSWCSWRRRGRRCTSTSICRARRRRADAVLFFNPKSGGGKAERFKLADEARARGIEPIELGPPWDLEALVRGAVDRGADALAMAGGDGSQAIVAAIAAELGLPYACIPAGTRNHFALDLGVDRDDVVGALDAFVDGGERIVDLAEVNGRVFVNNVSLGLYAEAVQRKGYRDAKLRTMLDTVPDVARPERRAASTCAGPGPAGTSTAGARRCWSPTTATGSAARSARARARGSTTACSGITVVGAPDRRAARAAVRRSARGASGRRRPSRSTPTGRSPPASTARRSSSTPPLHFRIRPGVLRVRIARKHPGASPSAMAPDGVWAGLLELVRIALGRHEKPATPTQRSTGMDLMEITEKERLSREDAAARLHALADALARHNEVEFDRGGLRFKVHVPDEVDFKLEIEIGDDERELEVELTW